MLNKNFSLDKIVQMKIDDYIHLYLGCNTNEGKLVGIFQKTWLIQKPNNEVAEISKSESIKPILRKLKDLSSKESEELNRRGISIGQRKGYSFTAEAIYYLLSIKVDLFNLIEHGLAIEK